MTDRTLTDADVQAIVDKLKSELVADFYGDLGRGVWAFCKKALIGLILVLAVYGMASSKVPFINVTEVKP
ncbi:hypothetical protein NT2_12_01600 [Caenibius tardaugens NBRC 16725]|uniref:Uncharacterized protein n=1 Tax=Caenibius tardaugens NBRC 16725 TaxID=1219035 RepID=U2YQF8_9SPHN|nr:hypothetical protein [Caenibius tardaugens]AZI36310.1 hypothetical protein EGO55_10370 [Caenibius tardaugens NBRC 16725]GAD50902.1 hypothetical protein NT2_12_01600 [Caenibius tardaugens NBRC 16725]